MNYCVVVKVLNQVLEESIVVVGTDGVEVTKRAKETFRQMCWKQKSMGLVRSSATIEEALMDGYLGWANGSICISWPEVVQATNAPEVTL